jgi:predicted tellurium resistance membrane protein TerC
MEWLTDIQTWVALVTLVALEIVLGIDNVIFISILVGKLPKEAQARARTIGLLLAVVMRVALLLSLAWIMKLKDPLFTVLERKISGKDIILIAGGLFLLWKSTHEIHSKLEGKEGEASKKVAASFSGVIFQIVLLDIVFSLDSVITAVGMVDRVPIMVAAIIIAIGFMIVFSGTISNFINRHPSLKILALAFLLMIGVALIAEGLHQSIPKGYIYFSMAFSLFVEILNLKAEARGQAPIKLREPYA